MERDKTLDRLDKHLVSIGKRIGHSDNGVTAFLCNEIDEIRDAIEELRKRPRPRSVPPFRGGR